jgi:proline racemase
MSAMPEPARVSAIDAHVAGGVVRLVTSGLPSPRGRSLLDRARWLQARHDELCRALVLEPRGHAGVTLAVLCEPADASADAGVLFRRAGGFVPLSGQGLLGAAVLALGEGLVHPRHPGRFVADTAGGAFALAVTGGPGGPATWTSPPAFVLAGGLPIALGGRSVHVDVAWGGAFFAIVDSEAAGLPLLRSRWPEFARLARPLAAAVESVLTVAHPLDPTRKGVAGVIFIGAAEPGGAQVRCLVAWSDGTVDRSASVTGTAALLAVFDAMGLAGDDPVQIEGLAGVALSARVARHVEIASVPAVHVEVTASAWPIARHEFLVDPADPLHRGVDW